MLEAYDALVTRLTVAVAGGPNPTVGVLIYAGIPALVGGLIGDRRGACIGGGAALAYVAYRNGLVSVPSGLAVPP